MEYSVPHSENLPFALTDGKEITIEGVALPNADRFNINLCEGPNLDTPTLLHFNPRFEQNQVVRTHNQGGWGPEETSGAFPFFRGTPYTVRIVVKNHAYQIFVNNTLFCEFNHRMQKEAARFLFVSGDTTISRIAFTEGLGAPIQNPGVPCSVPIQGGVIPGRKIFVDGVPTTSDGFSVNLVIGPSFDNNDIAFHFNPRFSQNEVVRTHRQAGNWGPEEKNQQFFPFFQNTPFQLTFEVEAFGIKVHVNGQHFADFNHRIQPVQQVTNLAIVGHVNISQVRFQ